MEFEVNLIWAPVLNVFVGMVLGGLIGLEREFANKPAGLRTHMLVAGASTLLVVLGDFMIQHYGDSSISGVIQADPIRIMEAIITGISFLGAGTIIFKSQNESVEGLTTAASILFAAAIGITAALQQYAMAAILTAVVILILFGLGYIEGLVVKFRDRLYSDNPKKRQ